MSPATRARGVAQRAQGHHHLDERPVAAPAHVDERRAGPPASTRAACARGRRRRRPAPARRTAGRRARRAPSRGPPRPQGCPDDDVVEVGADEAVPRRRGDAGRAPGPGPMVATVPPPAVVCVECPRAGPSSTGLKVQARQVRRARSAAGSPATAGSPANMPTAAPLSRNGPCGTRARRRVTPVAMSPTPTTAPTRKPRPGRRRSGPSPSQPSASPRTGARATSPSPMPRPAVSSQMPPYTAEPERPATAARRRARPAPCRATSTPRATSVPTAAAAGDRERQPAVVEVDHEQRDAGRRHHQRRPRCRRSRRSARPTSTNRTPVASSTSG